MTAKASAGSTTPVQYDRPSSGPGEQPRPIDVDICDPHHHLFQAGGGHGSYTVDDFHRDATGLPVVKTVFIECSQNYRTGGPEHLKPVGETEWVVSLTDGVVAAGIIGYVDLMSPTVTEAIAAHIDAGRGRFRGVRRRTGWDQDPAIGTTRVSSWDGMLLTPSFVSGVAALGHAGLTFDAFVYFHQLAEVAELARKTPDTVIIIDHLGGLLGVGRYAQQRLDVAARWRAGLLAAASCPNVILKVGGLGRPLAGTGWDLAPARPGSAEIAAACADDVLWAIEQFGTDRCMFESNFPVDRESFSYSVCWNVFDRITADFSPADRKDLFHDTAARTYRLG